MMKNKKLLFMIFTLTCFVAIGVCLIVNIAINRQITWGTYPLLSIVFGWAVLSPLLVKKHGIILLLSALTLLTLPYLYLMSKITPVTNWFMPIGLPIAIAGLITLWLLYPLYRYAKINMLYKSAISVFLLGAVSSTVVNYFVNIYLEIEPFTWNIYLNILICIVASAILGILGYMKSKPKSVNNLMIKTIDDKKSKY